MFYHITGYFSNLIINYKRCNMGFMYVLHSIIKYLFSKSQIIFMDYLISAKNKKIDLILFKYKDYKNKSY